MKSVLISIQPKWCELIASGKKTVEVRKSRPKLETPFKVYIYCTQDFANCTTKTKRSEMWLGEPINSVSKGRYLGNGKVIGEFVCDVIYETEPIEETQTVIRHYPRPWWYNGADDCLHHTELEDYLRWKVGYGWHISNLVIYDKPRELSEFRTLCKYRNDDGSCQYRKVECDCIKFDYNPDYSVNFAECCDFMIRPPKSWCYVESEVQGE